MTIDPHVGFSPPRETPATGNQPRASEKTAIAPSAMTNGGTPCTKCARPVANRSVREPGRRAAATPSRSEIAIPRMIPAPARISVHGNRSARTSATGRAIEREKPQSQCRTTSRAQRAQMAIHESSIPSCSASAARSWMLARSNLGPR